MQSRCWQISVSLFTFLMAASVYSQHYITAVAIKPVLLQVENKVSQQKNMVVFLLPLDIKRQYALSFPSVSPQKYQQQSSSREVSILICPCQCAYDAFTEKHTGCSVVTFFLWGGKNNLQGLLFYSLSLHRPIFNIRNCSLQNCCCAVGSLLRLCTPNSLIKNSVSRPSQALTPLLNDFSCRDPTLETVVNCMEMIQWGVNSLEIFVSSDKHFSL